MHVEGIFLSDTTKIETSIDNTLEAQSATVDGVSVQRVGVDQLIRAHKYFSMIDPTAKRRRPFCASMNLSNT